MGTAARCCSAAATWAALGIAKRGRAPPTPAPLPCAPPLAAPPLSEGAEEPAAGDPTKLKSSIQYASGSHARYQKKTHDSDLRGKSRRQCDSNACLVAPHTIDVPGPLQPDNIGTACMSWLLITPSQLLDLLLACHIDAAALARWLPHCHVQHDCIFWPSCPLAPRHDQLLLMSQWPACLSCIAC
jgi:hypothetical protein